MAKQMIMNSGELVAFVAGLSQRNEYPILVDYDFGVDLRSLPANSQQHVWYKKISEFTGEDIKTAGNSMKLDIGLPILLSGKKGAQVSWTLEKIEFHTWQRSSQINFMDILPVTSLFTGREHSQYRDNLQAYWRDNGLNLDYLNG